jgi:hypothetical protein
VARKGEILGWAVSGVGLYFVFFKEVTWFHLLILLMGITLILINSPYKKPQK